MNQATVALECNFDYDHEYNSGDDFDIACSNDEQKVISQSNRSETNLESKIESGGAPPTNNKSTEIVQDPEIQTNSNESTVACNKMKSISSSNTTDKHRDFGVQANMNFDIENEALEWHRRLGHISGNQLIETNRVHNLKIPVRLIEYMSRYDSCKVCIQCKAKRHNQRKRSAAPTKQAKERMDNWCVDEIGPFSLIEEGNNYQPNTENNNKHSSRLHCPSIEGHQYGLVITDEYARYRIVVCLRTKDEAGDALIRMITLFQTQTGKVLKQLTTDGGKELISKKVKEFLDSQGTIPTLSPPYTPERNGIAESMNYTLIVHTRCLLEHCQAPQHLWNFALEYSTYLYNRIPRNENQKIPHQRMWPNVVIHMNHIHTFGCDVHYWIENSQRGKLQPTTKPGIFVGYSIKFNAYKVLTMPDEQGKIKIKATLNVTFVENSFANLQAARNAIIAQAEKRTPTKEGKREFEVKFIGGHRANRNSKLTHYLVYWKGYRTPTWEPETNLQNCKEMLEEYKQLQNSEPNPAEEKLLLAFEYECAMMAIQPEDQGQSSVKDFSIPESYLEAINHPTEGQFWRKAIHDELQSLKLQGVFNIGLCILPNGKQAIDTRWVFAKKHNERGEVTRYKARLVARGFQQKEGIDYNETFSPTVRMKTLKIVLAIAAERDYEMKQIDFDTAFLNANVKEEIYVKIPQGYQSNDSQVNGNKVLRLVKAIYGTKQASREWWIELDTCLKTLGYKSTPLDECLYFKQVNDQLMLVTVYVDDMAVFFPASLQQVWTEDVEQIKSKYKIKELGDLNWILNMSVTRDRQRRLIFLSQETYIKRVLDNFNISSTNVSKKHSELPFHIGDLTIPPKDWIPKELNKDLASQYRSIIGSLIYAANITRPDIAYITNTLARYLSEPLDYHMKYAMRVLEYLYFNPGIQLTFGSGQVNSTSDEFKIEVYSDSDWSQSREDRKSVSGMALLINNRLISWQSKKQSTVALSSTEAEYYALTEAVKEAMFITQWFKHVMNQSIVPIVFEDNIGAQEMADHSTNHNKTKHIDLRLFFIRDAVKAKAILIKRIASKDNIADIFTKTVSSDVFKYLKKLIFVDLLC
jgi:hypothetical protein